MWQLSLGPQAAQGLALSALDDLRWWDEQGHAGRGDWDEWQALLAEQPSPVALQVLIPVESVTVLTVELPTRKQRWLQQALAYAVEEQLAEDVDALHLAIGREEQGKTRVLALRKTRLEGWLAELAALNAQVSSVQVDADQLASQLVGQAEQAAWCLWQGRGLWYSADGQCLAVTRETLHSLLAQHDAQGWRLQGEAHADWPSATELQRPQASAVAIELAQGDYAPPTDRTPAKRWLPVAALLGLAVLLQWSFNLGQGLYLQQQADALAEQSRAQYQTLFPQDRRIVNLEAQFREHLRQEQAPTGAGFIGQLQQVAGGLLSQGTNVRVLQVDYRRSADSLSLEVEASDFAALEALRRQLQEQGLDAQVGSASREGDNVVARVQIGGEA
ncbi:type II secretion system protein GspL [Atopomonas sediminilitoris]|uniref:type II secretion system protein GspL n=1 Tax=Atopomonas sediminilitoris TaxID=2919919 RepID=UPI001F4ED56B|nr:type II secretion system protein GspL [Atopomonas sediminilitoris]MCJ8168773.1 type II secretion system protein GspL [Atopomonas sediminilitoris]